MVGEKMPAELQDTANKAWAYYIVVNSILPITLGYLLFRNDVNMYEVVSCKKDFFLMVSFYLGNWLVHATMAVILIVFLCLIVKQLKDYGWT
jgi:uncharacterized membrane protein